ncbi:phosphatidylinositol-specific phospholipase C domain-containing protein [Pseudenhygromyxa sp. WMMC2535]|uniref:phosphatidylinositol-specific phospholipase C domain-containing protein n=1 Tax=Pseudenhygromyxa sp. WMMC2535 TaxID=2712867 RepID=UPI0031F9BDCD
MDWVSEIKDDVPINQLSIPGTHDAAAWTHHWDIPGIKGTWAQRKSITEQLDLGVRVLDLRIGLTIGWTFRTYIGMYHGPIFLSLALEDVLSEINTWLTNNSDEFVILIFQQQGKDYKEKLNRDLSAEVRAMVVRIFGTRFYQFDQTRTTWPTVGELRGNAMMMGRLRSDVTDFCNVREWKDAGSTPGMVIRAGQRLRIYLQDKYSGVSDKYKSRNDDNRRKFALVRQAARFVPDEPQGRLLRINHMSYSNLRYQPWESGREVNTMLRMSTLSTHGVLMIDDADQATVNHILKWNRKAIKK